MIVQLERSRDLRDVVERGVVEHGRPAMTVVVLFFSFHIKNSNLSNISLFHEIGCILEGCCVCRVVVTLMRLFLFVFVERDRGVFTTVHSFLCAPGEGEINS